VLKDVSSTKLVKVTNPFVQKKDKAVFKNLKIPKNYKIWLYKQSRLVAGANIYGFSIFKIVAIADLTHFSLKKKLLILEVFI